MGNMMNQVNAFGLQPFINVTLQGLQIVTLKYLHFHHQRFIGDLLWSKQKKIRSELARVLRETFCLILLPTYGCLESLSGHSGMPMTR